VEAEQVARNDEVEDVETVVERKDGYWVVQKAPGAPQRIARETDPRN
jgi:hypothetical protein